MDLREYLFRRRLTISDFARSISYGRQHVSNVINGRYDPVDKFKKIVYQHTNGEVNEWPDSRLMQ